ncbi:MAG: carbohydrate kinase family protein [Shimia sp.]
MTQGESPILCAGRLYCDLVFTGLDEAPRGGREVFAEALDLRAGGGAFITGAYLAGQGCPAGLVAVLPAPPFDALVAAEIARAGLASHCAPAQGEVPQVTVAFPEGGDRAFLTRRVGPALPDGPLPPARHLHFGELTTALERPDLIEAARGAGMTLSLDCAWDGAALAREEVAPTIAAMDLFFPNEAELAELARHGLTPAPRQGMAVKRGAAGSEWHPARGKTRAVPAQRAEVRDLTGAGDAFNAGFLAAWLAGQGAEAALARGNRLGAVAVGQVGGAGPGALAALRTLGRAEAQVA